MAPRKPAAVAKLDRKMSTANSAVARSLVSKPSAMDIPWPDDKKNSKAKPGTKVKVPQYDPKNKDSVQEFELAYAAQLSDLMHSMPRGAQVSFNRMVNKMDVRNLRGRLIAQVKLVGE